MTTPELVRRLHGARPAGKGQWKALCPAHKDRNPSLSVTTGRDGCTLLHCHAGCTTEAVVHALGLNVGDLFTDGASGHGNGNRPETVSSSYYVYVDEDGGPVGRVVRSFPKDFRQQHSCPAAPDGWEWGLGGNPKRCQCPRITLPLYRLPRIIEAVALGKAVYVAEGERDVEAIEHAGGIATTNSGGAGKWTAAHAANLGGAHVVIVADRDGPGQEHAQEVASSLDGLAASVKLVQARTGKDPADHLEAGHGLEDFDPLGPLPDVKTDADDRAPFPEHHRLPGPRRPERLPLDVLPPALAGHVASVTDALQVPHELPELLALACVSAAVAGRVEVEPRPGWREPVGIYAATIMPPGTRKSATFAAMTEPVRDFEAENIRAVAPRYLNAKDAMDVASFDLDGTKKGAGRRKATLSEVEAARLRLSEAEAAMPSDGRLLAGDVTPEALVQRFAAQGGRVAVLEPEPGPLQVVAGRYSDTARLGELNKAWSSEDLTVDRVGRPPLHVRRPALTLCVLLQPDVLEALPNGKALRAEGLVGRVLWCRPPHGLGVRRTGADVPPLDDTARTRYARTLRLLLELEPAGAEEDGTPRPHVLHLEPGALAVLHAFEAEVEEHLADGGRYASIRDWAGKMVGQSLRLAALLELSARAGDGRPLVADVGAWAMAGAVRLVRGLASHALAVLHGLDEDPRTADLLYVLDRLQGLPDGISESDLRTHTRGRRSIHSAEELRGLLNDLEDCGCVRRVAQSQSGGAGRPPSAIIELHPSLTHRPLEDIPEIPQIPKNTRTALISSISGMDSVGSAGRPEWPAPGHLSQVE